jgi:hypothetical protein
VKCVDFGCISKEHSGEQEQDDCKYKEAGKPYTECNGGYVTNCAGSGGGNDGTGPENTGTDGGGTEGPGFGIVPYNPSSALDDARSKIRSALEINDFNPDHHDIRDWINGVPDLFNGFEVIGISNYLEDNEIGDNVYEQEVLDFTEDAIEALIEDGDDIIDYELEMIIEINETIEFQEQTCLRKIKNDVVATAQISKIIKKFEPTYPVLHLEWGMFTNSSWGNTGNTGLNLEQDTAFINLNTESLDHVSNIVMVKTIAHEIIHAELYRKLKELVDDYQMLSLEEYNALQDNYPGIAHYTSKYGDVVFSTNAVGNVVEWGLPFDDSLAHHNQMANFYRETLIEVMKAYDLSKNITRDNPDEFYEAISWSGLRSYSDDDGNSQYYDAWSHFVNQIDIQESQISIENRTYNRYIQISNIEYGVGIPVGPNTGINCNE